MKVYKMLGLLLLKLSCITSCAQSNPVLNQPKPEVRIDTSTTTIIHFGQVGNWPFPKEYKPTMLNKTEMAQLDSLIMVHVRAYNNSLETKLKESYSVEFSKYKYKRQYVPVINSKGEKEVWANFFCGNLSELSKKEIFFVQDGGNCYFNLKINLTTKQCYELAVNGYA